MRDDDGNVSGLYGVSREITQRKIEKRVTRLGYDAVTASDGDAAWRLFEGAPTRLLVSDWMRPGTDGLSL